MPTSKRCWLCQQDMLVSPSGSRAQGVDTLREFVKECCRPTPLWYQSLMHIEMNPVVLCVPCINWKRRVIMRHKRNKSKKWHLRELVDYEKEKPLVQLDQLMMSVIYPGNFMMPDKRCSERLMNVLTDRTSMVWQAVPQYVRVILDMSRGSTSQNDIVRAWWTMNMQTAFFKNANLGKMVRAVIKYDEDCEAGLKEEEEPI